MSKLVIIEDSTVFTMLRNTKFTQAIPCLHNKASLFKPNNVNCGTCARRRQERQRGAMAQIKSCLAALSPDKRQVLKHLLNADKVRISYVNNSGQVVQLTF